MQVDAMQLESFVAFSSSFTSPSMFPLSVLMVGWFVAEKAGGGELKACLKLHWLI